MSDRDFIAFSEEDKRDNKYRPPMASFSRLDSSKDGLPDESERTSGHNHWLETQRTGQSIVPPGNGHQALLSPTQTLKNFVSPEYSSLAD